MRELVLTKSFSKQFDKLLSRNPNLLEKIQGTFETLQLDPFQPSLATHKLRGKLEGHWSCSVAYDLRIIFEFEERPVPTEQAIILLDIGSHDDVY